MIWYRHWVELRDKSLWLAPLVLLSGTFPMFRASNFGHSDPQFQQFLGTPLAQSIGADNLFVWAAFVNLILPLGPTMAVWLAGTGILILGQPVSSIYTLTLPVSRSRLIWTRLLAGSALAILATALALTIGWAVLQVQGRGVPLAPFALAAAFYAPTIMACTAVTGAFMTIHPVGALAGAVPLLVMSEELNRRAVKALLARGEMPWLALAALLAIAALGFIGTVLMSKRKDF
jgi:hypothetical protein